MSGKIDITIDGNLLNLIDDAMKIENKEHIDRIVRVHTPLGMFYTKDFLIKNDKVKIVPCDVNGKNLTYDQLFSIISINNEK